MSDNSDSITIAGESSSGLSRELKENSVLLSLNTKSSTFKKTILFVFVEFGFLYSRIYLSLSKFFSKTTSSTQFSKVKLVL